MKYGPDLFPSGQTGSFFLFLFIFSFIKFKIFHLTVELEANETHNKVFVTQVLFTVVGIFMSSDLTKQR